MKIKASVAVKVTKTFAGRITIDEIRKAFELPADAQIIITIPSGGDWSGEQVALGDSEIPHLEVRWVETSGEAV